MQITVEELFNSQEAFAKLARNESLAPAIKLRLLPVTRSFDQHVKDANEVRLGLFRQFGSPIEGADDFTLEGASAESVKAVQNGWKEALKTSINIAGYRLKFDTSIVSGLSTVDLMNLEWLIEVPEDVETDLPSDVAAKAATA